jgi:hypothetical protein
MNDRMDALVAAIQAHSGLTRSDIRQAGKHGADAGWSGFTYTTDGAEFTRSNRSLVWELLSDDAEEFGFDSVPAFVASFNRCDMAETEDGFDCLLSWYALESAGRYLELRQRDEDALRESGEAAGKAAGSWVSDGNSSENHLRAVLAAIEGCEFEIPAPLSGEWADGWTPERVFEDADVEQPEDADEERELLDVWEDAFREGYEAQAATDARGFLGVTSCEQCGAAMNPAERMLGPVCGNCCRANHRTVAGA